MTIGMYEVQSWSAALCRSAHESLFEPNLESKVDAIGRLALARLASLCASMRAVTELLSRLVLRFFKAGVVPLIDDCSPRGLLRAVVGVALTTTLVVLRVLTSVAGVICPELVFGVFRLHRSLLWWGLFNRVQNTFFPFVSPLWTRDFTDRFDVPRLRQQTLQLALDHIDRAEASGEEVTHDDFRDSIWTPAVRQAVLDEAHRVVGRDGDRPRDGGVAPVGAVVPGVPDGIAPIGAAFWDAVHVAHPILERFQNDLISAIHEEAIAVCQEGLYTKDEVEDMMTAFQAIMNRAVLRAVDRGFRVEEGLGFWGDKKYHLTFADGRTVEGQAAGGLEAWEDKLIEVKRLLDRTNDGEHLSADERALLPFYLCTDLDRCRTVRADIPDPATRPLADRCFKLIAEFSTTFVAHHMPEDGEALTGAFALPEA
jgi:hypothetical protein